MTNKTIRMLQLLDNQIQNCKACPLFQNGRTKPYWTEKSEFLIIGEAPGKTEVEKNEPFIGDAGKHLWEVMDKYGFKKEQFLIINSVNCRPVVGNRNGKPSKIQMRACKQNIIKYIKVIKQHGLLHALYLGNYASGTMEDLHSGIMGRNGKTFFNDELVFDGVYSIHPSMVIYRGEEGKKMLSESISAFKEISMVPF